MNYIEIMGIIAGFLTTSAYIPQLIKVLNSKNTASISLLSYCVACQGNFIWLFYGITYNSFALIVFSIMNVVASFVMIILKIKYSKHYQIEMSN